MERNPVSAEDPSHPTSRHEHVIDTHTAHQPHADAVNAHTKLGQTTDLSSDRRRQHSSMPSIVASTATEWGQNS